VLKLKKKFGRQRINYTVI